MINSNRTLAAVFAFAMLAAPAAAQDAPPSTPPATTSAAAEARRHYDNGFQLATGPDEFSLTMNAFVQTRYTLAAPEGGDAAQNFDIALARLALGGGAFDARVSYFFQLQASTFGDSNRLSLLDGWMAYRLTERSSVKAGRVLMPFSRQFLTHPGNLLFTDLSSADYAFNLPRAIGVHARAEHGRVSYDAAVANSVRALDAAGQQNRDGKLAVIGRVEVAVLQGYGYLESAPGASSARQLSIGLAAAHNPVAESSVFQNVQAGDRTVGVTLDGGYRDRRLTLQAAAYYRRNATADAFDRHDRGGYVQGGWYLVPDAWEVAARVSRVDFDEHRAAGTLGDSREYEVGVNRYLHRHNVKLQGDAGFVRHHVFAGGTRDDRRVRLQFQLLF